MYDAHTHFVTPEVYDWLTHPHAGLDLRWERKPDVPNPFLIINNRWPFELKPEFLDQEAYLGQQKRHNIHHSLVSPIPQLFLYEAEAPITAELARVYNDSLAQWCRSHPTLSALATLPLNSPELAVTELERGLSLGLKGAILAPSIEGRTLTHPDFEPLWDALNAAAAVLFVHPLLNTDPRIQHHMLPNLIGVLWETTVVAAETLLMGYLERYPRVRILLAHGGGYLPYHIGRMQRAYERWGQVRQQLSSKPQDLLRRYWFDSVVFNPESLRLLEQLVGKSRIVPGSDYPFDLCIWPPDFRDPTGFRELVGLPD